MSMKFQPWMLAAGAALVFALSTSKASASTPVATGPSSGSGPGGGGPEPSGPTHSVIDQLYALQLEYLPALREYWSKNKLRAAAIAAAEWYGIDPRVIWGVMWRESTHRPVGIYAGNPDKAKAVGGGVGSTAYGMGQILTTRFRSEKKLRPADFPWPHHMLLDPRYTIWSIAASYRRGYDKHGAPAINDGSSASTWLGDWWAGGGRGDRKAGDIAAQGFDVYSDDGSAPASSSDAAAPPELTANA